MKTILITGTSKGIGKALAIYYTEKGHTVMGFARGDATLSHEKYIHLKVDISDEKQVIDGVRQARQLLERVDVLLNNAAIASMNHLLTTPYTVFKEITSVNQAGTFLMMREVGKLMVRQKQGRIVNFTTVANPLNLETQSVYASSKAAVESLTKIAARELAPFNITVNAIGPTPVETGLIKGIPADWLQNVLNMQAIKRLGTMEDIYNAVDFCIDDRSSFITGQVIYLGGVN